MKNLTIGLILGMQLVSSPAFAAKVTCSGVHYDYWTNDRVTGVLKVATDKLVGVLNLQIDIFDSGGYHTGQPQFRDLACANGNGYLQCEAKDNSLFRGYLMQDAVGDYHGRIDYAIGTGADGFAVNCTVFN